jgi:hypothetical protein
VVCSGVGGKVEGKEVKEIRNAWHDVPCVPRFVLNTSLKFHFTFLLLFLSNLSPTPTACNHNSVLAVIYVELWFFGYYKD